MSDSRITVPLAQFAQKLKEKYPQYKTVADDRIVLAFVQRFPQYTPNYDSGGVLISVTFDRPPVSISAPVASVAPPQPVAAEPIKQDYVRPSATPTACPSGVPGQADIAAESKTIDEIASTDTPLGKPVESTKKQTEKTETLTLAEVAAMVRPVRAEPFAPPLPPVIPLQVVVATTTDEVAHEKQSTGHSEDEGVRCVNVPVELRTAAEPAALSVGSGPTAMAGMTPISSGSESDGPTPVQPDGVLEVSSPAQAEPTSKSPSNESSKENAKESPAAVKPEAPVEPTPVFEGAVETEQRSERRADLLTSLDGIGEEHSGRRSLLRAFSFVAALIVLGVVAYFASKTQMVRRYTQLPGVVAGIASDLEHYGEVKTEASVEGTDVLVAIRTGSDLIADDSWHQDVAGGEGCAILFSTAHKQGGIAASGTLKPASQSQTNCTVDLRRINPSGVRVVQVDYANVVKYKTAGYPFWEVHVPSAVAQQSVSCTGNEAKEAQLLKAAQYSAGEFVMRLNDPIAAESIAAHFRDGAHLCGARDDLADAKRKASAAVDDQRSREREAVLKTLISQQPEFGSCHTYNLEFVTTKCWPSDEASDGFAMPQLAKTCGGPSKNCYCSYSGSEHADVLQRLANADLVMLSRSKWGNAQGWGRAWNASDKLQHRVGTDITETKSGRRTKWQLVLGCREITAIEGNTAWADGQKIDFSWRWKPSDAGRGALDETTQRGVAYTKNTPNGMVVDRIEIAK